MNKSYAIMAGCVLMFIGGLLFLKTEMDHNRQILAHDVDQAVRDTPAKIAEDTVAKLDQALSNNVASNGSESAQTNDSVGSLFNLATDVGRRVDQIALNATELSDTEEIDFGRKLDKEILKDMPEVSDPVNLARLETLAKNLVSQCKRKQIIYHFRIVRSQTVNAFSIAGGYVYVTSTFLKRFQSDGELAMTLGHEIAHVELKHAVHKVQYEYHADKIMGDAGQIVQVGYSVLSSPFSKDEEYAADAWGFNACKTAGWKSEELFLLFEDLEKYEQETQKPEAEPPTEFEKRMGQYFDSHPPTVERLSRLKQIDAISASRN